MATLAAGEYGHHGGNSYQGRFGLPERSIAPRERPATVAAVPDSHERVAVTGANGFVGDAIVSALDRAGVRPIALVRPGRSQSNARIEVREVAAWTREHVAAALVGARLVVHAASVVHRPGAAAEEYVRFNVEGTRALIEACRSEGVSRLVFLSSIKVYGESPPGAIDESTPVDPSSAYSASKIEAERVVLEAGAQGGPAATVLRLCPVFGPGDKGNVRTVSRAIARRRFVVPGDGRTRKSVVHISTVTDGVLRALDSDARGIYVLADRVAPSMRELADRVAEALGRPPPPSVPVPLVMGAAAALEVLSRFRGREPTVSRELIRKSLRPSVCSPALFERTFGASCHVDLGPAIREEVEWLRWQRLL
jgi:UDP-glucose 4-epimerase